MPNSLISRRLFFFIALCIYALLPATSAHGGAIGTPTGFVNDFAGLLKENERVALETKLQSFKNSSTNEIAIAIIQTLNGDTIENVAIDVFSAWGIGEKDKDNGVLLLVALDEREIRIEVGYGLEGDLTDLESSRIIENIIVPAFQEEDFYNGFTNAINAITYAISEENFIPPDVSPDELIQTQDETFKLAYWFSQIFSGSFWLLFIIPWFISIFSRSKSWWGGGVAGGILGIITGFVFGFLYAGIITLGILIPLGLIFDYFISKAFAHGKQKGRIPWWAGGGGPSSSGWSSGGFGGDSFGSGSSSGSFGGGSSGGGGASGKW